MLNLAPKARLLVRYLTLFPKMQKNQVVKQVSAKRTEIYGDHSIGLRVTTRCCTSTSSARGANSTNYSCWS